LSYEVIHGDCRDVMAGMDANSVDAIVTDPPYGLSFMGKGWDKGVPGVEFWEEALRVAKPGAHLLAFGGTRMVHRLAVAIEDAGWEIRDRIHWVYGSGFCKGYNLKRSPVCDCETGGNALPYSHDKKIPKHDMRPVPLTDLPEAQHACDERGQVLLKGVQEQGSQEHWPEGAEPQAGRGEESCVVGGEVHRTCEGVCDDSESESSEGKAERVCVGAHSCGGTNAGQAVDGNRGSPSHQQGAIGQRSEESADICQPPRPLDDGALRGCGACPRCGKLKAAFRGFSTNLKPAVEPIVLARKPFKGTVAANVLEWGTGAINVDGCRVGATVETWPVSRSFAPGISSGYTNGKAKGPTQPTGDAPQGRFPANLIHDGSDEATEGMGDASRYFYCAKASKKDRDAGLDTEPVVAGGMSGRRDGSMGKVTYSKNHHPTVKPTDLMAYLCRLITPPGGTVLDPFNGSGSTGKAAVREGFNYIGCELDPAYVEIARARIAAFSCSSDFPAREKVATEEKTGVPA